MKWNKRYKFLVFSFQILICNSCFAGLAINYSSPSFSGVVIDDYTGKPVEGATVQVCWTAVRGTGNEHNSDMMDICRVTTITDKHGVYKIPAWNSKEDMEWTLYGAGWVNADNPECSISIPKGNPEHKADQIQLNLNRGEGASTFPSSQGFTIWTKNLKPPEWAISEAEVRERENPVIAPEITDEELSNSLAYYIVHKNFVENGRMIDTADFPKVGWIRPKPDVIITHIKSFSINEEGGDLWHIIDMPQDQSQTSGFSITLFQEDAKKIAELERKCIRSRNLLFMLGNKPLAETYMARDADKADSIPIPTGSQRICLPLRNHQDIQEINDALKKLVRSK